ncbi:MAG TPA: AAA family ATPase [Ktedonobacterales bacterium]|nr:AAA family ATPase [Ktedonobacterales bacterium]
MVAGQSLTFGALLRRHRRAIALTQEELAERAELSVEAVSALERGVSRAPHKDTVELLAKALRLSEHDRAVFEALARKREDDDAFDPRSAPVDTAGKAPAQLVGRAREAALLDRHLAGQGRAVLLFDGEPGIGKSRLLREASARGRAGGWTVLQSGCHKRGGQAPYSPLLDALQTRLQGRSAAQLRADLDHCQWLAHLLPELVEVGALPAPPTLAPEQGRRLMYSAVSRFLTNVAGPAGTLLILDDLQWADTDALDLLSALVTTPNASPLRVVGAYRNTEIAPNEPLAAALADLARSGSATRVNLGPLSEEEAAQLLNDVLQGTPGVEVAVLRQVIERAGGVPFFLVSCAQGRQDGALLESGPDDVPWDIAATVRQRIAVLPEAARALLSAAAADRTIARATLLSVAERHGRNETEALDALDTACRARVMTEVGEADYQIAHNLIREVIWGDLSAAQRALLHRQIADALERQPGGALPESLAYHYAHCGEREKAALYMEQAGDRAAAMHATTAAERYYRELVTRLDDLRRSTDAARAREKLASVLRIEAHYDESLELLERAIQAYRAAHEREGERQAVAAIGRVHARRGTPATGITRILALLQAEDASEVTVGVASLQIALADLYYAAGRYREQLAAAEQALTLAQALGNDILLVQAEQWRTTALLTLGSPEDALASLEEVIPTSEALGDLSSHLHALNHAAMAHIQRGAFDTSRAYIDRALITAQERNDLIQVAFLTCNRGTLHYYMGEWKQARADYERAAEIMRETPLAWASSYPLLGLGHLSLGEGQWGVAARQLGEAITLAERSGDLHVLRSACAALSERDLLEGRPEAARKRLAQLREREQTFGEEGAPSIAALLAWTHLEMDEVAQARELATQSISRAAAEHNRLALIEALRVGGMVAIRQGRWQEAENNLNEALSLSQTMQCPYHEARVRYVFGLLGVARAAADQASRQLIAARATLRTLGERLYCDHVERALAGLTVEASDE